MTMSRASEIVALALGQIGYKEKASNKNLDDPAANAGDANWTKYARDLASAGYYNGNKNGYAWCDVFVDWCFFKVYGKTEGQRIQCQTGPYGAGCTYSMQYYQQQGRCDKNPKVGDQIFFRYSGSSGADHTGIVVEVTSSQIVTVEGNSGNCVKKNTYARSNSTIIGYGHPLYSETDTEDKKTEPAPAPAPAPATEPTTGEIVLGSTVAFKASAERYNPNSAMIPDWVKTDYNHIVTQVTVNGKPFTKGGKVCVLLGKKIAKKGGSIVAGIMTWVAVDNLQLVTAAKAKDIVYTVKKGDTLWDIAKKYLGSGARYTEIVKLNSLKTSVIIVGQKLKIPTE
jgi:hypothetical protein